jgi:hypothetical protein
LFQLRSGSTLKTASQMGCNSLGWHYERSDQRFHWSLGRFMGLAGLEPAASSLSEIDSQALC